MPPVEPSDFEVERNEASVSLGERGSIHVVVEKYGPGDIGGAVRIELSLLSWPEGWPVDAHAFAQGVMAALAGKRTR